MRKWHRWLSLFFGILALWISVTGVASQIAPLILNSGNSQSARNAAPQQGSGVSSFKCPADMTCRPKSPNSSIIGTLHHLHSGESFGPAGVAIFILAGFAMIFFSASGMWMYIQMWRNRQNRALRPRWLWK